MNRLEQRRNFEWITKHGNEYDGKWVCLYNGNLLEYSNHYKDLYEKYKDAKNVVITRIFGDKI